MKTMMKTEDRFPGMSFIALDSSGGVHLRFVFLELRGG
jgi:hypothetical protein